MSMTAKKIQKVLVDYINSLPDSTLQGIAAYGGYMGLSDVIDDSANVHLLLGRDQPWDAKNIIEFSIDLHPTEEFFDGDLLPSSSEEEEEDEAVTPDRISTQCIQSTREYMMDNAQVWAEQLADEIERMNS